MIFEAVDMHMFALLVCRRGHGLRTQADKCCGLDVGSMFYMHRQGWTIIHGRPCQSFVRRMLRKVFSDDNLQRQYRIRASG